MATARQAPTLLRHIRRLATAQGLASLPDQELLRRFAAGRDEAAFAALVRRHGSMVLHVGQRVLRNGHDAEDVFQATFLVLSRKAKSIHWQESVGNWLYGVAYRLALKAKTSAARRSLREARAGERTPAEPQDDLSWREVQTLLDEELQRLPVKYRGPLVLCCLEGATRDEAARQLGCSLSTFKRQLERGRELLRLRLVRRGLTLSAALFAPMLTQSTAQAALTATLVQATVRSALQLAAGQPVAGLVSAQVAALVEGGLKTMLTTKLKVAMALLLAVSVVAGAGALSHQALAGKIAETPPAAKKSEPAAKEVTKPQPAAAKPVTDLKDQKTETVEVSGRVVNPDGKPVQGATIYYMRHHVLRVQAYFDEPISPPPPAQATSGADGSFRFRIASKGFQGAEEEKHWFHITLTAVAAGHGPGWKSVDKPEALKEVTLKLVKDDVPIEGRIVDLEGKPIQGATVRILGLGANESEDLKPWLEAVQKQKQLVLGDHYPGNALLPAVVGLTKPVVTAADGKFRLTGIGRERLVELSFEGPGIQTRVVHAVTRQGPTVAVPRYKDGPGFGNFLFRGALFHYAAAPTRPVVGVVRDKDTGKPLAGAIIEAEVSRAIDHLLLPDRVRQIRTTTDQEGRYRLVGLARQPGQRIKASVASDQPYLPMVQGTPAGEALNPVTVDFGLKRGLRIRGRVTNKETKQPMPAVVDYFLFATEPGAASLRFVAIRAHTEKDGSFSLVGLPGRGLLAAKAANGEQRQYVSAVGADPIPGLERGTFTTFPFICVAGSFNTLVEIKPLMDAALLVQDIAIDPGKTVTGKIVGPDGKPVAGVHVFGTSQNFPTAEFRIPAVDPKRLKLLFLLQHEKKLGAVVVLKRDESMPLIVNLEKCATLTGRLLDEDGQPRAGVELEGNIHGGQLGIGEGEGWYGFFGGQKTDKDGRFKIEGIMPGVKVGLATTTPGTITGTVVKEVTLKAGETKDLGDVQAKPLE